MNIKGCGLWVIYSKILPYFCSHGFPSIIHLPQEVALVGSRGADSAELPTWGHVLQGCLPLEGPELRSPGQQKDDIASEIHQSAIRPVGLTATTAASYNYLQSVIKPRSETLERIQQRELFFSG